MDQYRKALMRFERNGWKDIWTLKIIRMDEKGKEKFNSAKQVVSSEPPCFTFRVVYHKLLFTKYTNYDLFSVR